MVKRIISIWIYHLFRRNHFLNWNIPTVYHGTIIEMRKSYLTYSEKVQLCPPVRYKNYFVTRFWKLNSKFYHFWIGKPISSDSHIFINETWPITTRLPSANCACLPRQCDVTIDTSPTKITPRRSISVSSFKKYVLIHFESCKYLQKLFSN